jgi:hypothetical protein
MATDVITPLVGPTSCPANVRETKIAFGYKQQAALATANALTELWSLTKTNPALSVVAPITEDDANDIGKGDEFPTQVFPVNMDTGVALEKYCSSQFMAWLFCFSTGKATKTPAGTGFTYAAIPSDPVVNCLDLPPFTWAEQIRPQPDSVVDRALIGMVINDFTVNLESGPGRANCRASVNCVGTGKIAAPSTITPWPVVTPEDILNASGAVINIAGIDYVAATSFISMDFRWNNNVRLASGYYPGSGTQNGFAIRGRMEYGNRECTLAFVARAAKGSVEFNNLIGRTEGAATITVNGAVIGAGPAKHSFTISMPRTVFSAVVNGEADGIVTVNCTVRALKPASPGDYITLSATTTKDAILGL